MLNLQHALFCNDVSAHTHIYTHIILYKASIWILNVLFLITPLRIILLFTAPPKIIVHCAHYIESPYELCCILAHELLCVSRTFLKAPPQRMMLYFLLCLYTPLYSMHFVQTRHKNDCASHKNRPALLLCTLVPILFFAIYKQIKKVFFRQRPYRVECTGSLPNSEVKRRRARLVLGWGTAREDLRVLLALQTLFYQKKYDKSRAFYSDTFAVNATKYWNCAKWRNLKHQKFHMAGENFKAWRSKLATQPHHNALEIDFPASAMFLQCACGPTRMNKNSRSSSCWELNFRDYVSASTNDLYTQPHHWSTCFCVCIPHSTPPSSARPQQQ